MAQVQRLQDLPGSPVAALKYLSSSVTYRGSRGDLAEARRTYVEHPSLFDDEVRVIYDREKLYRSAKMGMWTYPGWRPDVSTTLHSFGRPTDKVRLNPRWKSSIGNRNSTTRWPTACSRK